MNRFFLIILPIAILALVGGCTHYYTGKRDNTVRGYATIVGEGITGEADLYEEYEGRVRITLKLEGTAASKLNPGRHAVHIHETGACDPFTEAKGHYDGNIDALVNPEAHVNPGLGNHPYHLGDLPNLRVSEDRKGSLYTITSRVTLSDGLNTLFDEDGSAFIVHELEDQYLPDPPTTDGPGGARIACGVIVKR